MHMVEICKGVSVTGGKRKFKDQSLTLQDQTEEERTAKELAKQIGGVQSLCAAPGPSEEAAAHRSSKVRTEQ